MEATRLLAWVDECSRKEGGPLFLVCLISTFVVGLIAHASRFFDASIAYDSVFFDRADDAAWQVSLGRYLEPVYRMVLGDQITTPWLVGFLSLLYIAVMVFLIMQVLSLDKPIEAILIAAVIVTSQPIAIVFALFFPFADGQVFSMLLAVLAVWVLRRMRAGIRLVIAGFALGVSLAVYQASIGTFVVLVMLVVARDILNEVEPSRVAREVGVSVLAAVLAGVFYVVGMYISLQIVDVPLYNGTNGPGSLRQFGLGAIPSLVAHAWWRPVSYFFIPGGYNGLIMVAFNCILAALAVLSLIRIAARLHSAIRVTLASLAFVAAPLGANLIYIATKGETYELMETSFVFFYIAVIMLTCLASRCDGDSETEKPRSAMRSSEGSRAAIRIGVVVPMALCSLLVALISWNGIVTAQGLYFMRQLDYQGTVSSLTRIIDRIEQLDGYEYGETPIMVVGTYSASDSLAHQPDSFSRYSEYASARSMAAGAAIDHNIQLAAYFDRVMDYEVDLHSYPAEADLVSDEGKAQIEEMKAFPAQDSCKMIDGVAVVKLSDV